MGDGAFPFYALDETGEGEDVKVIVVARLRGEPKPIAPFGDSYPPWVERDVAVV